MVAKIAVSSAAPIESQEESDVITVGATHGRNEGLKHHLDLVDDALGASLGDGERDQLLDPHVVGGAHRTAREVANAKIAGLLRADGGRRK